MVITLIVFGRIFRLWGSSCHPLSTTTSFLCICIFSSWVHAREVAGCFPTPIFQARLQNINLCHILYVVEDAAYGDCSRFAGTILNCYVSEWIDFKNCDGRPEQHGQYYNTLFTKVIIVLEPTDFIGNLFFVSEFARWVGAILSTMFLELSSPELYQ